MGVKILAGFLPRASSLISLKTKDSEQKDFQIVSTPIYQFLPPSMLKILLPDDVLKISKEIPCPSLFLLGLLINMTLLLHSILMGNDRPLPIFKNTIQGHGNELGIFYMGLLGPYQDV